MQRARLVVRGVVQGVGFRPFVYRLAREQALNGWVLNSTEGVVIEVEGETIPTFVHDLTAKQPPLARVERVEVTTLPPVGYTAFTIEASADADGAAALVSPDVAVCEDCRRELFDPGDRRYRYPFVNCTNCGPRFTIVDSVPYDRPRTSMAPFAMCPRCQAEYDDPGNRRFHAQPNACPACGPTLSYVGPAGTEQGDGAILKAAALLRTGGIVAVKGLGGFHLACDATNEAAVGELRRRKRRVEKPFAIMVPDAATAAALCLISDDERRLLESPQRPIVLLRRAEDCPVAATVAPGNPYLGVMLPYTPLHYLLLAGAMPPLVMTSGNLSEEPIVGDDAEAQARLGDIADAFLMHDRRIGVRCDDSVTRVIGGKETLVRRSRGYAPFPLSLPSPVRPILACGAELKNTFCLAAGNHAFLSHHIGDLENEETLRSFEEGIAHYQRLFRVTPAVVAHDLHPDYLSTQYARRRAKAEGLPPGQIIAVQHHHAHVASCMVENGLEGEVVGVAFDGTGYGLDGAVWGGEFLVAGFGAVTRLGHLAYTPLPGGAGAIRRPYRTALSFAYAATGSLEPALSLLRRHLEANGEPTVAGAAPALSAYPPLGETEIQVLGRQVRGLHSPPTSSAGRLFDAVSALAGVRQVVNYEGQAAIELEMVAGPEVCDAYPLPVCQAGDGFTLDHRPLILAVLADVAAGVPVANVAARFHRGLAEAIVDGCRLIRERRGLERVVLSGGVFQNQLLLALTLAGLSAAGFTAFTHHQVPCNDGGIALGQVAVANARLEPRCTN